MELTSGAVILTALNEGDWEISYATGEKGCAYAMESAGEMGYGMACLDHLWYVDSSNVPSTQRTSWYVLGWYCSFGVSFNA